MNEATLSGAAMSCAQPAASAEICTSPGAFIWQHVLRLRWPFAALGATVILAAASGLLVQYQLKFWWMQSPSVPFDRILVVHGGRIAEQGTFAQLRARGGLFAQLWRMQAEGLMSDSAAFAAFTQGACEQS